MQQTNSSGGRFVARYGATGSAAVRPAPGVTPAVDILTPAQAAAWLQVSPRELARLGVPCVKLGRKTRRYRRQQVLAWLESKAAA